MKQEKLIHPFFIVKIGMYFFAYECKEDYDEDMKKQEKSRLFVKSLDRDLKKDDKPGDEFPEFFNVMKHGNYIMHCNKRNMLIEDLNSLSYEDVKTWRRTYCYY